MQAWVVKSSGASEHPDGSSKEDWEFALEVLAKKISSEIPGHQTYPDYLKWIRVCLECYDLLPSQKAKTKPVVSPESEHDADEL